VEGNIMKTKIPSFLLTTLVGLTLAGTSVSHAHAFQMPNETYQGVTYSAGSKGHAQKHAKQLFRGLGLSEEQKQDIGEILRQTAQDNSVFQGEKIALRSQMQDMMNANVWDEVLATDLATQRASLSDPIQLNIAKAYNEAFLVLDAEQQTQFLERQAKRSEREAKQKSIDFSRLQERLNLSEAQVESLAQIQDASSEATSDLKAKLKAHRQAEKVLVFTQSFDEEAWSDLQTDILPTRIAYDVSKADTRYQMLQVLDEQQRAKFERITKNKKNKKGKGKRKNRSES
jgi:Spy/CpxP family protein refolding chaperone